MRYICETVSNERIWQYVRLPRLPDRYNTRYNTLTGLYVVAICDVLGYSETHMANILFH